MENMNNLVGNIMRIKPERGGLGDRGTGGTEGSISLGSANPLYSDSRVVKFKDRFKQNLASFKQSNQ